MRATILGVSAGHGVKPHVVNTNAVALLMVLAGAVLVQQVEWRRGVVVEDEERVPAVLAAHRVLTHDDGAYWAHDAADDRGGLGDLDLLGLGADVSAGLLDAGERG